MCSLFLENYLYIPSLFVFLVVGFFVVVFLERVLSSFQTCGSGINQLKLWDVQVGQQQAGKLVFSWSKISQFQFFEVAIQKSNLSAKKKNILVHAFSQQPTHEFASFYLTCLDETELV